MSANSRFSISIDEARKVVEVHYSGTINLDDRADAVDAASRALKRTGYGKVLVDLTGADLVLQSPHEEARFAELLSRNRPLARSRTAYLARADQTVNWFIETLARARHYQCQHFADREEAYGWLSGGGKS